MLTIIATVGWVLFDVWVSVVTAPLLPLWEWRLLVFGGGALALFTFIGALFDRQADEKRIADLKERLIKQEGFNQGAF